jgi:hypothetical protein
VRLAGRLLLPLLPVGSQQLGQLLLAVGQLALQLRDDLPRPLLHFRQTTNKMEKPKTAVGKEEPPPEPASSSLDGGSEGASSVFKEEQINTLVTKTLRKAGQRVPDGLMAKTRALCDYLGKIEAYDKLQKGEIEDLRKQVEERGRDKDSAALESQRHEKRIERMKDEYKKVIE